MGLEVPNSKVSQNFHLPSHDGSHTIFFAHHQNYTDGGPPSQSIILIHDVTDSHQRSLEFASQLLGHIERLNIVLMDLRGHGLSTGTRAHIDNFEDYGLDFVSIYTRLREMEILGADERAICIGQGMSGLMLLQLYQIYGFPILKNLKGLALFNPILRFRGEFMKRLPSWSSRAIQRGGESIKRLHLPVRFEGHFLTSDNSRANDYDSHPLVSHTITLSLLGELIEACGKLRSSCYFIDVPCFFVTSGRDHYVDSQVTNIYMKGIPKHLVTHLPYANLRHDIYNENLPSEFWSQLSSWIRGLK